MKHLVTGLVLLNSPSGRRLSKLNRFALTLILAFFPMLTPRSTFAASSAFKVKDVVARELTNVNGSLFFVDVGDSVSALWKSDGTPSGTIMIRDFRDVGAVYDPFALTAVNDTLFFVLIAHSTNPEPEFWKSDGTTAGTVKVKDYSNPNLLTNVDGTLFFQASDPDQGWELWKSDGTAAGTTIVKDINSGPNSSYPSELTNVDGTLFFVAASSTYGWELWKSDGTAAGTTIVKDIYPGGPQGPAPHSLANAHGILLFAANDSVHGEELWRSDGTVAGTVQVADINPGAGSSSPSDLKVMNTTLFFVANDATHGKELWASNGTAADTRLVRDIALGPYYSLYENPSFTVVNSTLLFAADDGIHGRELWKSDGTLAGTVLVKDIHPGATTSNPYEFASVESSVFFRADDGNHGAELWKSDGTSAGTMLAADIIPGSTSSSPGDGMTAAGKVVFFNAGNPHIGRTLWAYLADGDPFLDAPSIFGVAPGGIAAVPVRFGNNGALVSSVLITVTLSSDMIYAGDTLGTSSTITASTITWPVPDIGFRGSSDFRLRIRVIGTAYGTRYPLKLTMTAYYDGVLASRTVSSTLMVARQIYLPIGRR
jgi:ELWxxDGT repeat protein